MRQGNDVGTQYRSGIYTFNAAQKQAAEASKAMYEKELANKRYGAITTEIVDAPEFYFAEDYHQQYLAKNPARLLRARRHRRVLSDRHGRQGRAGRWRLSANCETSLSPQAGEVKTSVVRLY